MTPFAQVEIRERTGESCIERNEFFCPGWALDNIDRYLTPTIEHAMLVGMAVGAGFAIALSLALLSHGRRWLIPPLTGLTGVLYTIPSLAFFMLLLPITGRGDTTAVIALTAFTLQIIYRNIVTGLENVPVQVVEAGRGMGLTQRQVLWRVKLPLALPEIVAGVRIATVTTVGLAALAVFAGGSGLGNEIVAGSNITFRTGVLIAGGALVVMAIAFDVLLLAIQRLASPWKRVASA